MAEQTEQGQRHAPDLSVEYRNIDTLIPYVNNARTHSDEQVAQIAASIKEFGWTNPVLVDGDNGIIAGHGRVQAARKLGQTDIPVIELEGLSEAQRRAYILADNRLAQNAGWDEDLLHLELTELGNADFDLSLLGFDPGELSDLLVEDSDTSDDIFPEILESQLNESWRQFAGEIVEQYDALVKATGFSFSGITEGYAKIMFLRSRYYGTEYPRHCSLAFHPQQFKTSGDNFSVYDGLKAVETKRVKAERLRFCAAEVPKMTHFYAGALPFSGARLPLDFPALYARDLINEFAPNGRVLDQCHGWGGRLVGFLLSSACKYVGVDVSPLQSDGVKRAYNALSPLADESKEVTLLCKSFEDVEIISNFEFAITSPPYFDVEQYLGGNQSHEAGNYEEWRKGFFTSLIEKTYLLLKTKGIFALQVGSQSYSLLEDAISIAERVGFIVKETRRTGMTNAFTKKQYMSLDEAGESLLLLQKN